MFEHQSADPAVLDSRFRPRASEPVQPSSTSRFRRGSAGALLALTTLGCGGEVIEERPAPPRAVTVFSLSEDRPRDETLVTAVVEPYRQSDLGADVSGRLTSIVDLGADLRGPQLDGEGGLLLDPTGAVVRRGEVVARIDETRYLEAVAAAELAIESTERSKRALELELERVLAAQVDNARASYESAGSSVRAARDGVTVAESTLDLARTTVERDRALIASGAIAQSVLDSSESEFETATAGLSQAQADLDVALQSERSALAGLNEAEGALVVQGAEIDSLVAQLAELENDLEGARTDLESCAVRAPFSGRVTAVHTSTGAFINPGEPIVELTLLSPIKVVMTASSAQERELPIGAGVSVYVDADEGRDGARVATVFEKSSVADTGTRTFRIGLILVNELVESGDSDGGAPPAGMDSFFPVITTPEDPAGELLINTRCIYERGGRSFVLRLPDFSVDDRRTSVGGRRVPEEVAITLSERWEQIDAWTLRGVAAGDLSRGDSLIIDPGPDDLAGVRLGAPEYLLRPGGVVRVGLEAALPPVGLWVPTTTIVTDAGQTSVFLVEQDRARAVSVDVHEASGELRRISGPGLAPGASLVAEGAGFLSDGDSVQILGEGPGAGQ